MLLGIAVMTVWIPRRVGHIIDGLVAGDLAGAALWRELAILLGDGRRRSISCAWAGACSSSARRSAWVSSCARSSIARLSLQAPDVSSIGERTGDLMARATNDVDAVEMAAGEAFLAAFDGTLTLVLVVAMMTLGVDWRLGLVALLPFPFMALAFFVISRPRARCVAALARPLLRPQRARAGDRRRGAHAARARDSSGRAGRGLRQTRRATPRTRASRRSAGSRRTSPRWASRSPRRRCSRWRSAAGSCGTASSPSARSPRSRCTSDSSSGRCSRRAGCSRSSSAARPHGRGCEPVLRAPLSIEDTGTHDALPQGALRFDARDVRLSGARPAPAAVADVSFDLAPGRTLGIVGPTGAGKSTLLHLLLRHYAPQSGSIRFGRRPIADYTLAALRAALAWVPQEPFLFSATIADNIALARPDATRDGDRARRADGGPARGRAALRATATTRASASAASRCRAASGSAWPSRARCCPTRRCCCSTMRCPRSTPAPRRASSRICARRAPTARRSS